MQFVGIERGTCIEVTSSRAGEGKSVTTANLAVALAQAGQRVIVVDADLRGPSLHKLFGLPNEVGFTSVLLGQPLIEALQPVPHVSNLAVLTSGPSLRTRRRSSLSDRCREVLRALRTEAAVVLIDTPPLLAVTDPAVLAGLVDAVVLLSRIRVSTRRQVRRSVQLMSQMGAPLVGAVLNSATESGHAYYHHVPVPAVDGWADWSGRGGAFVLPPSVADPDRMPESGRSRAGPPDDDGERTAPPRPEARNRPGSPRPAPPVKPRSRF